MYCKDCKMQIEDNARFCSHCGAKQEEMVRRAEGPEGRPEKTPPYWILGALLFLVVVVVMAIVLPSIFTSMM